MDGGAIDSGSSDGPSPDAPAVDVQSRDTGAEAAAPSPTRWLVFNQAGVFAYDVTKFPADSGTTTLAADGYVSFSSWSPNGRQVLYLSGGTLFARDMTTATPGDPALLVSGLGAVSASPIQQVFSWSPDAKSVVALRGT